MQKKISKNLLANFGILETGEYNSKNIITFQNDITEAIEEMQMLAIIGKPGAGKSTLVERVKDQIGKDVKFIYVRNYKKEFTSATHIIEAVFADLQIGDSVPRSTEGKSRMFIRVVGKEYVELGKKICIVIEEAHRLNVDFLRTLKEMREADYARVSPLFSVVLIGHPLLAHKLTQCNEAGWRTISLVLSEKTGWFDYDERVKYLQYKFGTAITAEARRRIATYYKLPLEMDQFVENKMYEGSKAGKKILDNDVIEPTPREVWDMLQAENPGVVSYRKVAKMIGVSASRMGEILAGEGTKKQETSLKKALAAISEQNKAGRIDERKAS